MLLKILLALLFLVIPTKPELIELKKDNFISPFENITIKYCHYPIINYPLQISFPPLNFSQYNKV